MKQILILYVNVIAELRYHSLRSTTHTVASYVLILCYTVAGGM